MSEPADQPSRPAIRTAALAVILVGSWWLACELNSIRHMSRSEEGGGAWLTVGSVAIACLTAASLWFLLPFRRRPVRLAMGVALLAVWVLTQPMI